MLYSILSSKLWGIILEKLFRIDVNYSASYRLVFKYFNELILNIRNKKYKLLFSKNKILSESPILQLDWACRNNLLDVAEWVVDAHRVNLLDMENNCTSAMSSQFLQITQGTGILIHANYYFYKTSFEGLKIASTYLPMKCSKSMVENYLKNISCIRNS